MQDQSSATPRVTPVYVYHAVVVRVHDGDTVLLAIDQGLHSKGREEWIRLIDVWAPELGQSGGALALRKLMQLLPVGSKCVVTTQLLRSGEFDMSFARYCGHIFADDSLGIQFSVNEAMVQSGLAKRSR